MDSKFKNIILFSPESEKIHFLKSQLENIKYIRLFETSDIEETQQIIDMSEKAVVLVDDEISANKFFKATLNKKKAHFKKFYINWYKNMAVGLPQKLREQDFTLISSYETIAVIKKVELYLFGRVNIFNNKDLLVEEVAPITFNFKKGYFSHLEKSGRSWKMIISSHETDDEINKMLGKNWDLYLEKLLQDAVDFKSSFEARLEAVSYHELVYPHMNSGEIKKLSIVHLSLDENFASNLLSVYSFLKTLD